MKTVVQRVSNASVIIEDKLINEIAHGYLIYVGFTQGDNLDTVSKMADKIINLRIFEDDDNKLNRSIKDVKGEILAISQFTLYGDTKGNNRPSFTKALDKKEATILYDYFLTSLNSRIVSKGGVFGSDMKISAVNDGPVTIIIEL
ncbi:D-tyrosyl-tRNA(Tyr) deacylase [Acholeplasma sp. OttesenSCG-928-E16]|nr:D-tyrosyl-tRNA(Tyr) deacylase [Acholeplasma sp. OttesenSCG-928-E16]